MKTEIKKILYKFLQDGITSDDAAQQVLDLFDVSGSLPVKRYDIDFGGNLMAGIEIKGESLKVFGAMNGYGDGIDDERIKITERRQ